MAGIEIHFLSEKNVDRTDLGRQEVMDSMAQGVGTLLPYYESPRDE